MQLPPGAMTIVRRTKRPEDPAETSWAGGPAFMQEAFRIQIGLLFPGPSLSTQAVPWMGHLPAYGGTAPRPR